MNYGDFELSTKLNDDELIDIVLKRLNFDSMDEVINFFNKKENIEKVKELKDIKRISQRQLSRIIGVNNKLIAKYWSEDCPKKTPKRTGPNVEKYPKRTGPNVPINCFTQL